MRPKMKFLVAIAAYNSACNVEQTSVRTKLSCFVYSSRIVPNTLAVVVTKHNTCMVQSVFELLLKSAEHEVLCKEKLFTKGKDYLLMVTINTIQRETLTELK